MTQKIVDLSNQNALSSLPSADGYIFKLTGGSGYVDTYAESYIKLAKAAGKPFSVYHFAVDGYDSHDIDGEVSNFVQRYEALGLNLKAVFLDYEATALNTWSVSDVNNWCEQVADKLGVKVYIYCSESYINAKTWSGYSASTKFWVAKYSTASPSVSVKMVGWQYTSSPYDTSTWYDDFSEISGKGVTPSKSGSNSGQTKPRVSNVWVDALGDTWHKQSGKVTLLSAVNLRMGARTTSTLIATLPYGSTVKYDAYSYHGGYVWVRQPRGNSYGYLATGTFRNGRTAQNWAKWH